MYTWKVICLFFKVTHPEKNLPRSATCKVIALEEPMLPDVELLPHCNTLPFTSAVALKVITDMPGEGDETKNSVLPLIIDIGRAPDSKETSSFLS